MHLLGEDAGWRGRRVFFFSSRRRHTRFDCDWSSDVCSSDLWHGGVPRDLGTLGGWASHALAINGKGKVVGWSLEEPNYISHAFEWSDGVMIDLGSLAGHYSAAFAINAAGVIVGASTDANNVDHAVMWEGGPIEDLNQMIAPGSGWFLNM